MDNSKGRREAYVVVEICVRDRDEVCCVRQIDEAIIGIFANILVAGQVAVIDPNVC